MAFDKQGTMFVTATLSRENKSDIVLPVSRGGGDSFSMEHLSSDLPRDRRWWPNLECPTGHNVIAKHPSVLFTAGSRGQTPRYFVERLELLTANTGSWLNAHSRGNSHGGRYKASDNFQAQKNNFPNSVTHNISFP